MNKISEKNSQKFINSNIQIKHTKSNSRLAVRRAVPTLPLRIWEVEKTGSSLNTALSFFLRYRSDPQVSLIHVATVLRFEKYA